MTAQDIGNLLEDCAVDFLQRANVDILHRNFRCRFGEVDIIARDQDTLVFVEVRYRKNSTYGDPAETITMEKQQKIIHTAQFYLQTRNWASKLACRFDVIALSKSQDAPQINWIKDAFHV